MYATAYFVAVSADESPANCSCSDAETYLRSVVAVVFAITVATAASTS